MNHGGFVAKGTIRRPHRDAGRLLLELAYSLKAGLFFLNRGIKGIRRRKNAVIMITDDMGRFKKINKLPPDISKD